MARFLICSVLFFVCISMSQSESKLIPFEVPPQLTSPSIFFSIGYTAGTHKGVIKNVRGKAILNSLEELQGAQFQFSISDMETGNVTRDCHMREALGLNYSVSDFPKKHVCDANNAIPLTGPNAIQFPTILFVFESFEELLVTPLKVGDFNYSKIAGTIEIHGIKKRIGSLPIQVKKMIDDNGLTSLEIVTQFEISLKDFDVVVKPFKIGFISIGVSDKVLIDVRLPLKSL